MTLEQWQARGNDRHSIVADPRFRDLAGRDFALAPDSPAWSLGFRPIDLSDVGPRERRARLRTVFREMLMGGERKAYLQTPT